MEAHSSDLSKEEAQNNLCNNSEVELTEEFLARHHFLSSDVPSTAVSHITASPHSNTADPKFVHGIKRKHGAAPKLMKINSDCLEQKVGPTKIGSASEYGEDRSADGKQQNSRRQCSNVGEIGTIVRSESEDCLSPHPMHTGNKINSNRTNIQIDEAIESQSISTNSFKAISPASSEIMRPSTNGDDSEVFVLERSSFVDSLVKRGRGRPRKYPASMTAKMIRQARQKGQTRPRGRPAKRKAKLGQVLTDSELIEDIPKTNEKEKMNILKLNRLTSPDCLVIANTVSRQDGEFVQPHIVVELKDSIYAKESINSFNAKEDSPSNETIHISGKVIIEEEETIELVDSSITENKILDQAASVAHIRTTSRPINSHLGELERLAASPATFWRKRRRLNDREQAALNLDRTASPSPIALASATAAQSLHEVNRSISTPIEVRRKRGRPRKNSIRMAMPVATISAFSQDDRYDRPVGIRRKRGRPRKSLIAESDFASSQEDRYDLPVDGRRKRGRPRKDTYTMKMPREVALSASSQEGEYETTVMPPVGAFSIPAQSSTFLGFKDDIAGVVHEPTHFEDGHAEIKDTVIVEPLNRQLLRSDRRGKLLAKEFKQSGLRISRYGRRLDDEEKRRQENKRYAQQQVNLRGTSAAERVRTRRVQPAAKPVVNDDFAPENKRESRILHFFKRRAAPIASLVTSVATFKSLDCEISRTAAMYREDTEELLEIKEDLESTEPDMDEGQSNPTDQEWRGAIDLLKRFRKMFRSIPMKFKCKAVGRGKWCLERACNEDVVTRYATFVDPTRYEILLNWTIEERRHLLALYMTQGISYIKATLSEGTSAIGGRFNAHQWAALLPGEKKTADVVTYYYLCKPTPHFKEAKRLRIQLEEDLHSIKDVQAIVKQHIKASEANDRSSQAIHRKMMR